jgi:hypothetical protein
LVKKPEHWDTWKGQIIRAIVLDGAFTKNDILKTTGLNEERFETGYDALFTDGLLKERYTDSFWVNSPQLCKEYRDFFAELQNSIINFVCGWRINKRLRGSPNHFFLDDKLLDELSEKLIENAYLDVLVASPYVQQCHLSNTLMSAIKKRIRVRVVARPTTDHYKPKKTEKYHLKLKEGGVSITYDDSLHAKLIVVDRAVAIVSSMNFIVGSMGGASYEAGIVTVEPDVVHSVAQSIINRL